jgi:hypothetical protein
MPQPIIVCSSTTNAICFAPAPHKSSCLLATQQHCSAAAAAQATSKSQQNSITPGVNGTVTFLVWQRIHGQALIIKLPPVLH